MNRDQVKVVAIGYDSPVINPLPPVNNNEEMRTTAINSGLHFDHTSILKTIARRFMSQNPPYMGARYAAAHDLSEVLSTEMQKNTGQFLPFVPYTLEYENTKMNLDVRNADRSLYTLLQKSVANPQNIPDSQKFRFEDAGEGYVYVRTFAGLFVTVLVSEGLIHLIANGVPAYYVMQDLKFPVGSSGSKDPNLQKWKLVPGNSVTTLNTGFVVYSAAFPNLVLQPADPSTSATVLDVVLSSPTPSENRLAKPNQWNITSPLIPQSAVLK